MCAPGYTDPASHDALIAHCEHPLRQDRVAILDIVEDVDDVGRLLEVATAGAPDRPASRTPSRQPRAIGGGTSGTSGGAADAAGIEGPSAAAVEGRLRGHLLPVAGGDGPGLRGQGDRSARPATWPGVWARTDATRGVHKAPANTNIAGAIDLKSGG